MRVRVLFFGMLRELVGRPSEESEFPAGAPLRQVFDQYAERYPQVRELAPSIVVARNQEFADLSTGVVEGDVLAFLPPVSGGTSGDLEIAEADCHYLALTLHTIDSQAVIARVQTGVDGA